MADVFEKWNKGRLNSYLIEITEKILRKKDKEGNYVIDTILDTAGSKGTGKWASIETLDLGVPAMSMSMAVFCRYISDKKIERVEVANKYQNPSPPMDIGVSPLDTGEKLTINCDEIERALYTCKILAYAQGYELMAAAAKDYSWQLDFEEISRIWQGGCIIRAQFLKKLTEVFATTKDLPNIILDNFFKTEIEKNMESTRKVICEAIKNEIPIAEFCSALSYFDSIKSKNLPANLLQAQRDFFGAHTYQTEIGGDPKHFEWE